MDLLQHRRVAFRFSPLSIGDCHLWLDASDTGTITHISGSISQWGDKSGKDNHASQSTPAFQPITDSRSVNGLNVVDFDGSDDYLRTPTFTQLNQPNTCFIVTQSDVTGQSRTVFDGSAVNWRHQIGHDSAGSSRVYFFAGSADVQYNGYQDTLTKVWTVNFNGSSSAAMRENGETMVLSGATSNPGGNPVQKLTIGARYLPNQWWNGHIAEVLFYSRNLTTTERDTIESYLIRKWGIEVPTPLTLGDGVSKLDLGDGESFLTLGD